MKIFVITSAVPFRSDGEPGVTAIPIATSAIVRALKKRGHTVILQCLFDQSRALNHLTDIEERERQSLVDEGFIVPPPLYTPNVPAASESFRSIRLLLQPGKAIDHFYPGIRLKNALSEHVKAERPDIVLPLWSPQGFAACADIRDVPVVVYHGDIDTEPFRAKFVLDYDLFSGRTSSWVDPRTWISSLDRCIRFLAFRRAHLRLLRSATAIANIAECIARYYSKLGFPRSTYVRSAWIDSGVPKTPPFRPANTPIKIIGHVGYLNRTGSTYGLQFLLREVLPSLDSAMQGHPYEVHIIGGGEPALSLRPLLAHPRIVRHGFVEDLEGLLDSSDVFCLFNNAGPYIAAYTRHFVAWSHGLCLVAHARSREAIPEIAHGQNALLAQSGKEAAQCIASAALDQALNHRLRLAGRKTYETFFTPDILAKSLERVLFDAVTAKIR